MEIRKAELKELEQLKWIEQEIIRYERPMAPSLADDPINYYDIAQLIENEDTEVLVAVIEQEIVGSGYATIKKASNYKKHTHYAYLGFMYVSPEHRGRGINGMIIDRLIQWATSRNISEIQLEVYASNEAAIRAYHKKGFKPDLISMRLNTDKGLNK